MYTFTQIHILYTQMHEGERERWLKKGTRQEIVSENKSILLIILPKSSAGGF